MEDMWLAGGRASSRANDAVLVLFEWMAWPSAGANLEGYYVLAPRNKRRNGSEPKPKPVVAAIGGDPVTEERIRSRAYLLFEQRQRAAVPGDSVSDWLRAESELNKAARQPRNMRRA
jgi:hypothetical protein